MNLEQKLTGLLIQLMLKKTSKKPQKKKYIYATSCKRLVVFKLKEMEQKIIAVSVTVETINKVFGYLATKPYAEVAEIINLLQQSEYIREQLPENGLDSKA